VVIFFVVGLAILLTVNLAAARIESGRKDVVKLEPVSA
jgi:hypothetical protein